MNDTRLDCAAPQAEGNISEHVKAFATTSVSGPTESNAGITGSEQGTPCKNIDAVMYALLITKGSKLKCAVLDTITSVLSRMRLCRDMLLSVWKRSKTASETSKRKAVQAVDEEITFVEDFINGDVPEFVASRANRVAPERAHPNKDITTLSQTKLCGDVRLPEHAKLITARSISR